MTLFAAILQTFLVIAAVLLVAAILLSIAHMCQLILEEIENRRQPNLNTDPTYFSSFLEEMRAHPTSLCSNNPF